MIFGKKKLFYFSRIISQQLIIASHLKPFLSYLPCIMCREYFSIIFNKIKYLAINKVYCWSLNFNCKYISKLCVTVYHVFMCTVNYHSEQYKYNKAFIQIGHFIKLTFVHWNTFKLPYFIEYSAHFLHENDAEIFPVHCTWKVAEKGFKIAFMMNKLAMIISFAIILEK